MLLRIYFARGFSAYLFVPRHPTHHRRRDMLQVLVSSQPQQRTTNLTLFLVLLLARQTLLGGMADETNEH